MKVNIQQMLAYTNGKITQSSIVETASCLVASTQPHNSHMLRIPLSNSVLKSVFIEIFPRACCRRLSLCRVEYLKNCFFVQTKEKLRIIDQFLIQNIKNLRRKVIKRLPSNFFRRVSMHFAINKKRN